MAGIILLAALLGIYILFLFWYNGFRKPLTVEEVDRYVSILKKRSDVEGKMPGSPFENIRKFALEDDGRQFFMCNLSMYYERPQSKDGVDAGITSRDLNKRYARSTMPQLLKRACHPYGLFQPLMNLRNISGQGHSDWDEINVVRYRSRRDFLNMITSPQWFAGYGNKQAALQENPNFPSKGLFVFPVVPIVVLTMLLLVGLIGMACIYLIPLC
jgi:hypothetical protein